MRLSSGILDSSMGTLESSPGFSYHSIDLALRGVQLDSSDAVESAIITHTTESMSTSPPK
jgi:hypothetical protein